MDERLVGVQHIRDLIEIGYILAEEHASVVMLCAYVDAIEAENATLREENRLLREFTDQFQDQGLFDHTVRDVWLGLLKPLYEGILMDRREPLRQRGDGSPE